MVEDDIAAMEEALTKELGKIESDFFDPSGSIHGSNGRWVISINRPSGHANTRCLVTIQDFRGIENWTVTMEKWLVNEPIAEAVNRILNAIASYEEHLQPDPNRSAE